MSNLSELKKNWRDRGWWQETAMPYLVKTALKHTLYEPYYSLRYGGRCDIMEEDWDNLVILDACRYDDFRNQNPIDGDLDHRISKGAVSGEFLRENFDGSSHHDTVYVTANPWVSRYAGERFEFHDIVEAWKRRWDDDLKTVPPDEMVATALETYKMYPDKRLIIHFMQPHQPFLGEKARSEIGVLSGNTAAKRIANGLTDGDQVDRNDLPHVWSLFREGTVERGQVREFYRENLALVLEHVTELIEAFDEKTVVTADHGEMFGERPFPFAPRVYGHNSTFHPEALVKVPWLTVEGETRKRVVAERPTATDASEDGEVSARLRDLGYAR